MHGCLGVREVARAVGAEEKMSKSVMYVKSGAALATVLKRNSFTR